MEAMQGHAPLIPKERALQEVIQEIHKSVYELTNEQLERLLENKSFFHDIDKVVWKHAGTLPKKEAEWSSHDYGAKYTGPKSIEDQAERLQKFFPSLDSIRWNRELEHWRADDSCKAEGIFLCPDWRLFAEDYRTAAQLILDVLLRMWGLGKDSREKWCMSLSGASLTRSPRTCAAEEELRVQQGDAWLIPAQFGLLYRGISVEYAQQAVVDSNGFLLGLYHVGMMILTHPERFHHFTDLAVMCGADIFSTKYVTLIGVDESGNGCFLPKMSFSNGKYGDGFTGIPTGFRL